MNYQITLLIALLLVSTGAWSDEVQLSYDGLVKVPDSIADEAWVKPFVDLRPYNKIMLAPVEIAYKTTPPATTRAQSQRGNYALTNSQTRQFSEMVNESLVAALSDGGTWEIVTDAGPDVLLVQAEIIDLVVKAPTDTQAVRGSTLSSGDLGELTLALEIRSSQSREIYARAADRRFATVGGSGRMRNVTRGTQRRAVRGIVDAWSEVLRIRLDQLKEISNQNPE